MKWFLGKCVEYSLAALVFVGLFFVLRMIAGDTDKGYMLTVLGSFFLVLPISLLMGYFLARPLQRRLERKGTSTSKEHTLQGTEKPHGVVEDRNHTGFSG
jgi:membrane protein implicated in regulation of membrane protease activity